MKVTDVKLHKAKKPGVVKAFGKAILENTLSLDVLIMDKGEGAWATLGGGRAGNDGKWYTPMFFLDKEKDTEFKAQVVEAYNTMSGGGSTPTTPSAPPVQGSENLPF